MTTTMITHPNPTATVSPVKLHAGKVYKALTKRSFATLATSSPSGQPHVAGVLYEMVGLDLYINTMRPSRKARNVETNDRVGVTIPIRRIPFGPPSTVHFQGTATVLAPDSSEIRSLVEAGELKSITSHGELEVEGSCFVRISPKRRLLTYGLGLSLITLIRDPLNASGKIELSELETVARSER